MRLLDRLDLNPTSSFDSLCRMHTFSGELNIIPLCREHARAVADLHISGIHTGFISSLGSAFVTVLYESISENPESFGFVAIIDGRVAGFVSITSDVGQLYRVVFKKNGFRFVLLLGGKLFTFRTLRRIGETFFYRQRLKNLHLPEAEILSMAVAPEARFYGLGPQFIRMGLEECCRRGISEVNILAAATLAPINKMYRLMGFQVRTQVFNHGILSNIYVVPTDFFLAHQEKRDVLGSGLDYQGTGKGPG